MKRRNQRLPFICIVGFACTILLSNTVATFAQEASVKVIAHRGGRAEFDENTLSAFVGAYDKGVRYFETDIRITKDGHLVIYHDADLKRIGAEGSIEQKTLREVKALRTKKGNPIPTLDELLKFFNSKPGLSIEFELKTRNPEYDQQLLEKYVHEVCAKVYADMPETSDYFLTSFDKRALVCAKQNNPSIPMLLIFNEGLSQRVLDEAKALNIDRIGCRLEGTTRAMVRQAHEEGFKVSLGPTPTINDFLLGVALGCDYVCPDIPVQILDWVAKNASWIKLN
jgi:glycerophosphoryl diester phosphodiesterase